MLGNTTRTWFLLWGALLTVMTLKGCTEKTASSPEVSHASLAYLQYQVDALQEQIEALEINVADLKAQGESVPPGYYAQLGLLYFSLSKTEQSRQRFSAEQDPFEDATARMNELMDNVESVEPPASVDTPHPPQAGIETPAQMYVGLEPFSFIRAFTQEKSRHFIF